MEIATILWLIVFGVLIISTFSLGTYYLSEWKEGLIDEAKYSSCNECYKSNVAEAKVKAKISFPIWISSFIITFGSLIGIIIILINFV